MARTIYFSHHGARTITDCSTASPRRHLVLHPESLWAPGFIQIKKEQASILTLALTRVGGLGS